MPTKVVLLHQENSPVHKSVVAMATVLDCVFKMVDHLPYPPDLAAIATTPQTCLV